MKNLTLIDACGIVSSNEYSGDFIHGLHFTVHQQLRFLSA